MEIVTFVMAYNECADLLKTCSSNCSPDAKTNCMVFFPSKSGAFSLMKGVN